MEARFGAPSSCLIPTLQQCAKPAFTACLSVLDMELDQPCLKPGVAHFANHWKQFVTTVDADSWTEEQDAKLDTTNERWFYLPLCFTFGIAVKDHMSLLADVSDRLRILIDGFVTKTPVTLVKKEISLQRCVNFLDTKGFPFPGLETALYRHLCVEKDSGSPSRRLQLVAEALRITERMLGVSQPGTGICKTSGAAANCNSMRKYQRRTCVLYVTSCNHWFC